MGVCGRSSWRGNLGNLGKSIDIWAYPPNGQPGP